MYKIPKPEDKADWTHVQTDFMQLGLMLLWLLDSNINDYHKMVPENSEIFSKCKLLSKLISDGECVKVKYVVLGRPQLKVL